MSCKSLSEEVQKKYENEISEFLIQRINHVGGSLQFQHLSGLLQQLRFEIKDAFGATKSQLMKFLRSHPKIFKVDSNGVVTVVGSILLDNCGNTETDNLSSANTKKTLLPKIENGVGVILNIFPEFAVIKATEPIETYVYFTPPEYGASKDSLFIDLDLEVKTKVCFNAVHGHNDYEIEYRATKVWKKCNSDNENSDSQKLKSNTNVTKLSGKGIIKKVFPKLGFISVVGNENKTVLFHRNSVKDCDINVTDFFKVGDCVEFAAKCVIIDSKRQWQATEVIKVKEREKNEKEPHQPSASSGTSVKIHDKYNITKKKIENQAGKIYPYSHGAVIKFGKSYSELADGDSSDYFLYGSKVSDIAWEFSEGDDIFFDAVKTKNPPGWKTVLVWVGEKPTCTNDNKQNIDEDSDEVTDDQNYISLSNLSSESSNSSTMSRTKKSKFNVVNAEHKEKNKSNVLLDHPVSRKLNRSQEYRNNNSETSETNSQTFSIKKSKYKKANNKPDKKDLSMSKHKLAKRKSVAELTKISNVDENYNSLFSSEETVSDINLTGSNQSSSEEDNEVQSIMHNFKEVEKDNEYEHPKNLKVLPFTFKYKFKSSPKDEINSGNKNCEVSSKSSKNDVKKASIKKFEDIDGEIIHLYCKVAIIQSSQLQKDADFVLNAFYLNGKSVEEQQVIDLKEVIKIGDIINFNCFEIIDDLGDIYQKVTMAWKGPKPKVYEITPEEFIAEHELSVSINSMLKSECIPENKTPQKSSFAEMNNTNSDETFKFHSYMESSLNNISDDTLFNYPMESKNEIHEKLEDDDLSADVHHKLLSGRIIQRLKTYGFISSDSEVHLNIVHEIINLVLKNSSVEEFSSSPINKKSEMEYTSEIPCSSCGKRCKLFFSEEVTTEHAEVQTVVTGEIVATSIYTQN